LLYYPFGYETIQYLLHQTHDNFHLNHSL